MKRRTTRALRKDFYEAQAAQRRKSLFLLPVLVLFYVLSLGLIIWILWALVGGLVTGRLIPSGPTSLKLFFLDIGIALTLAFVQYIDARQNGARFIIRRLQAEPPDPRDRYHVMFSNTLDEMRIAAGLPKVRAAVLPTFAINSMALIEPDATPVILVTEGLLAAYTRDELQAVIAHELAHVLRGDAVYITLVCSLVNFFERIRESLEPEESPPPGWGTGQSSRGGAPLLYAALTISTLLMHGVSTLISRQRELLADAVAVELTRNPQALARAVYKAHLRNSFVGDFNIAYSPLLIVPPRSSGITDGFFSRLFNTHPPLMRRIRILAEMASARPAKIIQDVWDTQKRREKARVILHAAEETRQPETPATERDTSSEKPGKVWMLRNPQGEWLGPWSVEELTAQEAFTPTSRVLNTQEHLEAPALDFPQIRMALHGRHRKSRPGPSKKNTCPRCRTRLKESFYEGLPVRACPGCGGKLVDARIMDRIVARKEVAFSDSLKKKAEKFEKDFLENPVCRKKIHADRTPALSCPSCGSKMLPRPYNYQYVIPVDKCLSCHRIWFDTDELEILQILIEKRTRT
ncbi:MAG: M48 family metalloprotease [Candidatus Aminicenantales bacterium]